MCGIAGKINFSGEPVSAELLGEMIGAISHRGPDETGFYRDRNVGLAHARLSIIDLESGSQPISNEDKTIWIVFNGEIFNYVELREGLVAKGHRFSTRSDTEVIVHLYEEMGEECVTEMNGQWAFCLFDSKRQKLFLSRDRMGIRPLFYRATGKDFVFASEIKSIFCDPSVEREIDPRALDQIFTFWVTVPPTTAFRGIGELPAGHSMTVQEGRVTVEPYWRLDYPTERSDRGRSDRTCADWADELRHLLIDATRLRLRSDVPVGAYLSGGLDSSVTTAMIKHFTDSRLRTFSVTFDDPEFDESRFQNDVIDLLDTDHSDIRCAHADIGAVFPDVVWHAEKPVVRTAPAPLYLLSSLVRQNGYKVVLTGEGSDEILGGYDIFKEAKIRRFWSAFPESRKRPLLLKKLYPYLKNIQAQPEAYLKAFFHVRPEDLDNPFFSHLPRWEMTAKLKLFFSREVREELGGYDVYDEIARRIPEEFSEWDHFCQAQYLESAYLMPGYILSSQGDRVAMAHSIEGRYPFLDHRVVELAAAIPPRFKMKVLDEKHVLKKAAEDLVPASVKSRPKQPYRAPEAISFFEGDDSARDYVHELLSPTRIEENGLFHVPAVEKLIAKVRKGQAVGIKDNMALVSILSTQLVVEQFVRNFGKRSNHGTDNGKNGTGRT